MSEPRWVAKQALLLLHGESLAEHGGMMGIRDEGLLDSALERPRNQFAYGGVSDIVQLAAAYAFGIARNHPFIDGNKRTAFVCCELFLALNGHTLQAEDGNCVSTMLALAAGELPEADFAAWIRTHTAPL